MSNAGIAFVGRSAKKIELSPKYSPYSKLDLHIDGNKRITSGADSGRTLVANLPWGTRIVADNIRQLIEGYEYQPYTATGANVDPAIELGDGIDVSGVYSGVYLLDITFNSLGKSTISAPNERDINHEIQVVPRAQRSFRREVDSAKTEISLVDGRITAEAAIRSEEVGELRGSILTTAEQIRLEVSNRKSDVDELWSSISLTDSAIRAEASARKSDIETLRSEFSVTPESINAKVDKNGGSYSSFGWSLTSTYWELSSNGATVLKVDKSGAEIRGKITAESGKIGGFDIKSRCLSTNGATWNSENNYGVYIGPEGIKLGKKFKVDNAGNIVAGSAIFEGKVSAKNILIEGEHGYMDGRGILAESIFGEPGREIAPGGIQTFATNGWINGSLGNGNWSADCWRGNVKFDTVFGHSVVADDIYVGQLRMVHQQWDLFVVPGTLKYTGPDGNIWEANVMFWTT